MVLQFAQFNCLIISRGGREFNLACRSVLIIVLADIQTAIQSLLRAELVLCFPNVVAFISKRVFTGSRTRTD